MMESTYSCSSFSGLVSSKRRFVWPPNSAAKPKFRQIDFACPKCKYPLGSGGNRVCTRPSNLLASRSRMMMSRMKFDCVPTGADAAGAVSVDGLDGFMKTQAHSAVWSSRSLYSLCRNARNAVLMPDFAQIRLKEVVENVMLTVEEG